MALVGWDFRHAPSAARGALVLTAGERRDLSALLAAGADARGFAALDTCGRTEWIVDTPQAGRAADLLLLCVEERWRRTAPNVDTQRPRGLVLEGMQAARHLLRVAVGLESFVPGEREVARQFQAALARSRSEGHLSPWLGRLGSAAGRAVRRIERAGGFRGAGGGVPELALGYLARRVGSLAGRTLGIVGLGDVGRRVLALAAPLAARTLVFNRTPTAAPGLACLPLSELLARVRELDALVLATSSPLPLVEAAALDALRSGSGRAPLVVLDLGLPAQLAGASGAHASLDAHGLDAVIEFQGARQLPQASAGALPHARARAEREVERALSEALSSGGAGSSGPARLDTPWPLTASQSS